MIREPFLSRRPSHFQSNFIVKAFLISETLLWSSWNFVFPIIALFVISRIKGGNVETVAGAYSTYLIARVIAELLSGKFLNGISEVSKLTMIILGMTIVTFAYIGFIFSSNFLMIFGAYVLIGIGLGISSPCKLALFSNHIDKTKASTEWSLYDALPFTGMAIAGIFGGFIATRYGFDLLFLLAAALNLLGIAPYFYIYRKRSVNLQGSF